MKYSIEISKTAQGDQEYLQILSEDSFSVNVVLLGQFDLRDSRREPVKESTPEKPLTLLEMLRIGPDEDHDHLEGDLYHRDGKDYVVEKVEEVDLAEERLKEIKIYGRALE
jgi:hypothetical protein